MSQPIQYCRAPGCNRRCHAHGYCLMHHKRLLRTGTLFTRKDPPGQPFWYRMARHLKAQNGCWIWTGAVNDGGYGIMCWERRPWLVHRLVWMHLMGPTNLILHHECREPRCANPWHLIPMTRKQHLGLHALEWK